MHYSQDTYLVGIDEVGRGPLAGPVTVCAFCVPKANMREVQVALDGITDSKKLSAQRRERYVDTINTLVKEGKCRYKTASVGAQLIDAKGITYAIKLALKRALLGLQLPPEETYVYLDGGLQAPADYPHQETIIKGDIHNKCIATASVIAKVKRDAAMTRYAKKYPEYLFDVHKGYGTAHHRQMIREHGPCNIHRKLWIKN